MNELNEEGVSVCELLETGVYGEANNSFKGTGTSDEMVEVVCSCFILIAVVRYIQLNRKQLMRLND